MQGHQNYKYPNKFHKTKEQFNDQIKRDEIKRKICLINNIKLALISEEDDFEFILIQIKLTMEENPNQMIFNYAPIVNITKLCRTCNIEKIVECFHKNINSKDGYLNECRDCRSSKRKNEYKCKTKKDDDILIAKRHLQQFFEEHYKNILLTEDPDEFQKLQEKYIEETKKYENKLREKMASS